MEFATIVPYRRMAEWEGYREPDLLLDLVEEVDRLGFYAFCAGDHLIMPNEWRRVASEHWFDPTTFLAYAAARTSLRLLTFGNLLFIMNIRNIVKPLYAFFRKFQTDI